jgi:predicted phage terminase large subunit-like protein
MDEEAKLLWETRYKLYDLMKMWAENEISFMSEMQNLPRNPADCILDVDKIVYWDSDGKSADDLLKSLGENVKFYMACDPSLGLSTVKGDPSAIIVLAKDVNTKNLYIIVADIKRRPVEAIIEIILAYYVRFRPVKIGIEANQFQRVLIDMVKKEGEKTDLYPVIEPIINKDDKIARIQTLRPRINSSNLQFSKKQRQILEEARYFPKGRHCDGLDALEMAVRLSNDNGFMFWLEGDSKVSPPDAPIYPTPDGLVPYGYYRGRRH